MADQKPKKTKFGRRKFQKGMSAPKGRNNRSSSCNERIYGDLSLSPGSKALKSGLSFGKFGIKIVRSAMAPSPSSASPIRLRSSATPQFPKTSSFALDNVERNSAFHPSQETKEGTIRIFAEELLALHQDVSRQIKALAPSGGYQIWPMVFPDIGVSSKPAEVKMGKSKGSVDHWCTNLYPGKILFEIDGVSEEIAKEATLFIEKKTRYSLCLHKEDVCL